LSRVPAGGKDSERFDIFGKNPYWAGFITIEKLIVFVGEWWIGLRRIQLARFHDFFANAKSTKLRSMSVSTSLTTT
jgi:hypothetical protein